MNLKYKKYIKSLLLFIPDRIFLRLLYLKTFKKILHLNHPKTFNEKLQHLKLKQTGGIFTTLADKYAVREFVKEKIGEDVLVPLLWHGENPDDIPFDRLPNRYIIKCNHGMKCNIFVPDSKVLDREKTKAKLKIWLKENFGEFFREKLYVGIKRQIVIEEFLPGEMGQHPMDYKMHCFNGKVDCIIVALGRGEPGGVKCKIFDREWKGVDYWIEVKPYDGVIEKPKNLDKLIQYAEMLSQGFPFVRVDMYNIDGKIYFGEMTLSAYAGQARFFPNHHEIDERLGKLIQL